jgi:hypothetical protein
LKNPQPHCAAMTEAYYGMKMKMLAEEGKAPAESVRPCSGKAEEPKEIRLKEQIKNEARFQTKRAQRLWRGPSAFHLS